MIGRRTTIGIALLCALVSCAFAAQSASAVPACLKVTKAKTGGFNDPGCEEENGKSEGEYEDYTARNTTAFTCVKDGGNLDFKDSHCNEQVFSGEGEYGHVSIPNDTTTEMEVSQEGTSKLNSTLAGVATEITCKKVASATKEGKSLSFLHNVETVTEHKDKTKTTTHTVTGTAQVNFTECTVIKPAKCKIKEPIIVTANAVGVERFGESKNEMGVVFVGEGAEETFAELTFENNGGTCSIANGGKAFKVKGSAISTPNVGQGKKHNGATAVYEDANDMEMLEIGLKKVSFAATFTTSMAGAGGNPISATTVT